VPELWTPAAYVASAASILEEESERLFEEAIAAVRFVVAALRDI
jgi:hypothetical protein